MEIKWIHTGMHINFYLPETFKGRDMARCHFQGEVVYAYQVLGLWLQGMSGRSTIFVGIGMFLCPCQGPGCGTRAYASAHLFQASD